MASWIAIVAAARTADRKVSLIGEVLVCDVIGGQRNRFRSTDCNPTGFMGLEIDGSHRA